MGIIFIITIAFIFFLLEYKVETTIKTKVNTKGATHSVYVNSQTIYKVKQQDMMHIRIGGITYTAFINEITFDENQNLYQLKLSGLGVDLLPNSTLDATIIIGSHSIGSFLFGSV